MAARLSEDLREILAFMRGERGAGMACGGIRTSKHNPEYGGLHDALVKLERAGTVRCVRETDDWSQWIAVEGWREAASASRPPYA